MKKFGLIGFPVEHSFSPQYFKKKFDKEGINDVNYTTYSLPKINQFSELIAKEKLDGFNVTLPHKQAIIPFLHQCSTEAIQMNSVNVVKIIDGKLIGYNTDIIGFTHSLCPLLPNGIFKALILGDGGSSKMVQFTLRKLGISFTVVSRKPNSFQFSYQDLEKNILADHQLIINTTPVGQYPNIENSPLPTLDGIGQNHLVYDLVYNPLETELLKMAKQQNATTKNGLEMLEIQAEESWKIWSNDY